MSWLMTSIANSLKLDQEFGAQTTITATSAPDTGENQTPTPPNPNNVADEQFLQTATPRGVKNDLTEISNTLSRRFWGVASFLAPPPQFSDPDQLSADSDTDPVGITGLRNDLSEIGGKFRTGISRISGNKAVSEFTKIATNLLHFGSGEGLSIDDYARGGVVGVTEEVVAFARDIALHPKTWLDFPLPDVETDFDLSDAQQEHALAIERLAPELAALNTELCPGHMNDAYFWKIYFMLVHPILSRHDAEILSTPEIVRAREMLAQESHSRGKPQTFDSGVCNASSDTTELSLEGHKAVSVSDQFKSIPIELSADIDMDKHPVTNTEIPVIDKRIVEEESIKQTNIGETTLSTSKRVELQDEDDADDWLKEENNEGDAVKRISYPVENDDDISFSDLEDDEKVPTALKKHGDQSDKVSGDIQESSGWLDIEDIEDIDDA